MSSRSSLAPQRAESSTRRLDRSFFEQSATDLGLQLPGKIMVRSLDGVIRRARIVEVEAYLGPRDLASHSSKGRTQRTEVMFGPAGRAYVYFIYGMHFMLNVVAGVTGEAHAVLIRAAEPLDGWEADLTGPGKLARAFVIHRGFNGVELFADDLHFLDDPTYTPHVKRYRRVGIDYAKHWKNRLLRFIDMNNPVAKKLRYR
jgi:DNA-3-methyladenine glycosylase